MKRNYSWILNILQVGGFYIIIGSECGQWIIRLVDINSINIGWKFLDSIVKWILVPPLLPINWVMLFLMFEIIATFGMAINARSDIQFHRIISWVEILSYIFVWFLYWLQTLGKMGFFPVWLGTVLFTVVGVINFIQIAQRLPETPQKIRSRSNKNQQNFDQEEEG